MFANANLLLIRLHEFVRTAARHTLRFSLFLVVLGISGRAIPQTNTVQSPGSLHFEIVSIKPSKRTKASIIQVLPNGFEAIGFPLGATLTLAYFPPPFYRHEGQLHGYPKWLFEDIYDIEARVPPSEEAQWQLANQDVFMFKPAVMLQSMLKTVFAERCLLRVHTVDSKTAEYALTIPNRKKSSIMIDSGESHPPQGAVLVNGGFKVHSVQDGVDVQSFYQTSMPSFVEWLNLAANYPIVDRTGLTAKYRFSIRHAPPDHAGDPEQIVAWRLDEIGIKLVKEEIISKTVYIDQIEKPSPN